MKDTHSAVRLEEEEFIAATKELFDLSFERARRFYLEGQPTPAPQEARCWSFAKLLSQGSVRDRTLIFAMVRAVLKRRPRTHILLLAPFGTMYCQL